jgi:hypothetical protein
MRVSHALCMRPVTVVARRSDNATAHGGGKVTGAGSVASATTASNQGSGANHKRRRRTNASTDDNDAQRRREFESGYSDRMAEPSSASSSADAEDFDYFCRFCGVNVSPHDTCSLISVRFEGADIPFTCVENAPSCLDLAFICLVCCSWK